MQVKYGQCIIQVSEVQVDVVFVGGFLLLMVEWLVGDVEDVVEYVGGDMVDFGEFVEIEGGLFGEGVCDEQCQVD